MGDVGDEPPSKHLRLLQRVRHAVERVAESRDLHGPRRLDALCEVALREALGGDLERADRAAEVAGEEDCDDRGDEYGRDCADVHASIDTRDERLLGGPEHHAAHVRAPGHHPLRGGQARQVCVEGRGKRIAGDQAHGEYRAERHDQNREEDLQAQSDAAHHYTSTL